LKGVATIVGTKLGHLAHVQANKKFDEMNSFIKATLTMKIKNIERKRKIPLKLQTSKEKFTLKNVTPEKITSKFRFFRLTPKRPIAAQIKKVSTKIFVNAFNRTALEARAVLLKSFYCI
jgi:hypothetical protein